MKENELQTFSVGPLNVHVLPSTTYKTNTLVLHMRSPLEKKTVTKRALLPFVLQSGTESYPSRQAIRKQLDDLYGATLNVDVAKKGEYHLMSFRMEVANEKFLSDSRPLFERALDLFSSVILSPKASNGSFDKAIVDGEKRTLKQKLSSVYDDKMRYANKRLTEEMCKDEPFGLFVLGDSEDVDGINEHSLYQYYEEVLKTNALDLYVVGDVELESMKQITEKHFSELHHLPERKVTFNSASGNNTRESREVIEEQDVQQGKLHIGYRTNVTYGDDEYFALQLFNGVFGGFSHSKLFINVREKASLAYYAASRVESHKGLLIVLAGIESNKFEDTTKIIFKQMEEMQAGNFSDEDLKQTKAVLKNQLLETMDVPRGYIELEYHNELSETKRTFDEWINRIDNVTKEDIVKVAKKIKLDTVYFLKGKEEAVNE
ncbi:EF-P 5-aminopentanol modification-associated protein YfmF [Evansella cellulosilytica]|uniref:Peptidase M16 domain protein n=1 Tax=Evansella cellulosilytica (strain ATCC 21833 / DSM 2522 / FERM P-1141 / JCM 9156 / N-4) TaxID=649639 RepID=E6TS41_EVAC2|nr:pitrilysin family protein [Evansella cellulosilytica]ADU30695.1 peptidase M16 domain protein [Evansella cellulosilytica DSM 2522]